PPSGVGTAAADGCEEGQHWRSGRGGRPGPGPAAGPGPAPPTGNFDNGRVLAYTCQGCHGITGYKNAYPSYRVPKIGGQTQQYLAQALTEYRQGKRRHPTMQAQSMSFSEQEIADLSVYLSTVK
ncbi:c-type cytochrome, partial [Stenotrophomonas maltophilia]|uniref:c-type cytochrome n=1 Tax=Stenotrophomonas maltophilia TaxID=40324 RepID=UPI00289D286E